VSKKTLATDVFRFYLTTRPRNSRFNVPLDNQGNITDDIGFKALPTIQDFNAEGLKQF